LVQRIIRLIYIAVLPDSLACKCEYPMAPEGSPCYLKGLYGALWLWPQGSRYIVDMMAYTLSSRYSYKMGTWAYLLCTRPRGNRLLTAVLMLAFTKHIYMPTIGLMFWLNVGVPNPLVVSLYMELINMDFFMGACDNVYYWHHLYPAFVSEYMHSCAVFLGICEAMRHLGSFLTLLGWPAVLFCGDPMKCWRSQYLHSHGGFYDAGGNQGNISYICWYLFSKSQKRQCCCPYRKLKADAPEKCCPPCCLGPLVEETGGCPCPCCCASCSG